MSKRTPLDIVFDLRGIIAVLFTIYGVVCVIWGLAFTDSSELARSGGENVNLWAGVSMLVFAALMWFWAIAKPELPPVQPEATDEADAADAAGPTARAPSGGRVQREPGRQFAERGEGRHECFVEPGEDRSQ